MRIRDLVNPGSRMEKVGSGILLLGNSITYSTFMTIRWGRGLPDI
jgi:hypothetical protein